ncbi:hypothetical protein BGX28_001768 [Mortierella sp. GBA30]|nr:hypothetical protein BGX28_001768 [Mortierella sp. GBA30]
MQCNPGGYFRVQRLFTPSTNYTIGSGAENPAVRCHNDPSVPIALNEATRAYVDNFAGPDTFRAVLTGPEYYLTQQQINLGNCVYALPYVLSRPGRFFLTKIEHLYQNFDALNENYNATFAPRYIGKNILPTIPSKPREPRWGDNQTTIEAWLNHKVAASKIHQFTVCGGCPQVFDPASWTTYDDLPICSLTAYDGARQHGVYAGRSSISQYQDLESQTYEWVGARPSCRHHPRLVTFTGPKTYTMETTAMPIGEPMYGGPSSSPSPDEFSRQHDATMNCLNRNRTIYFVGDSHIRVLYDGLVSRLQGVDGNLHRTKTYKTRYAQIGGVYIRQEFDQWLLYLNVRIRHVLAQGGQEQQLFYNDYHLLETFDTLVFDFGAWAAAGFGIGPLWTSDLMFGYIKKILWSIAQVRYERQIRYKMTGKGYPDLRIVWMGMVPWPDAKAVLDMRTNTRLKYWDLLIDSEIDKVNAHYSQWGGMIDRLGAFSKLIPYRHLSFDQAHHTEKRPVDALVQALIHKLDLCREEFEHDLPPLPEPDPEDLSIFPPAALFQEASLLFLEIHRFFGLFPAPCRLAQLLPESGVVIMILINSASLLALLSITTFSAAHSPPWPAITYSETIYTLRHEILPRKTPNQLRISTSSWNLVKRTASSSIVQQDDQVKLELLAFNRTFYLHLQPNYDLIHPSLDLSEHEDPVKAFKGIVIADEGHSRDKWARVMHGTAPSSMGAVEHLLLEEGVLGWARLMIEHDSESMVLRGAFSADGDVYHVNTRQHYHIQKRSDDHIPSASASTHANELIVYRDSDLYKRSPTSLNKRQILSHERNVACGAHTLVNKTETSAVPAAHGYYYPSDTTASVLKDSISNNVLSMSSLLGKRQDSSINVVMANSIPPGCPTSRLVNYMGVAADCTYVQTYGGLTNARKQIFADFNTASGIYESTFNVALGIVSLQVESMVCPQKPVQGKAWNQQCSTNYTMSNRLSDFSYWRGQKGRNGDGVGLWHLMTKCSSGSILGLAWTKALCQTSAQAQGQGTDLEYSAGTGVSSVTPNEWMVVAHEVGHGFGANHDCTSAACVSAQAIQEAACCPLSTSTCNAEDQYIMNPSEQAATTNFSPCSINAICSTIASTYGQCLKAPEVRATQLMTENICGNGIREEGEQCDCGTAEECAKDPCCNGTTCTFKGKAVCDDLNDDCCHNCQLAAKGTMCRSAISNCDVSETCSGTSAVCPADVHIPDLTNCDILNSGNRTLGYGQCANGICTSRDYQCAQTQRPGVTKQCEALVSSCELICNDPNGGADSCLKISGANFSDGTACGTSGKGVCSAGQCIHDGSWAATHLQILIPVICAAIFLLGAAGWIIVFFRRRRRRQAQIDVVKDFSLTEGRNGVCNGANGEKDPRASDIPKWMMTGDRRSSMSSMNLQRKNSQISVMRRDSFLPQAVLTSDTGRPSSIGQQRLEHNEFDGTFLEGYVFQDPNTSFMQDVHRSQH